MAGHGHGVEAGLLRPPLVHPRQQVVGQALGDEVGDHQHIGLGKGGLLQLDQRLLEAGHQIGPPWKLMERKRSAFSSPVSAVISRVATSVEKSIR